MSGNVIVFVARVLISVKQRRRCAGAMKIVPKAAEGLINAEIPKVLIRKMPAMASGTRDIIAHLMKRTACRDEMQGMRRSKQRGAAMILSKMRS